MTKTELIVSLAKKSEIPKYLAEKIVNSMFDAIQNELAKGGSVQIIGFGTFENRERSARKGRNPRTGEEIQIAASNTPVFKAGKIFKQAVNGVS